MFTTRTERDSSYIVPPSATKALGPGSYAVDKSTLKRSAYKGMAPFNSRSKATTFVDDEIRRSEQFPSVGEYAPSTEQNYIRGNRQTSSCFCSTATRFVPEKHITPGPGEYFKEEEQVEKNLTKPAIEVTLKDEIATVSSIPYERKEKEKLELNQNSRSTWIAQEAEEQLQNPGPGEILQSKRREFIQEAVEIPVGGASTSLAHIDGENAWARAPERMQLKQTLEEQQMGPGKYDLSGQFKERIDVDADGRVKNTASFKSVGNRHSFVPDKSLSEGPGTYYVEGYNSIEQREFELRQQIELKEEEKEYIKKIEEMNAKLLPSVTTNREIAAEKTSNERNYYTAIERAMMDNPAVGTYTKELTSESTYVDIHEPKITENAMNKLALQQTFNALKWPESACSIPANVITDEDEDIEQNEDMSAAKEKSKMPSWDKQLDRNLERIELAQTGDLGPGDYELRSTLQEKSFSMKPSYAFSSTYERNDVYQTAKATELQEHITQEEEIAYGQEQEQERQVGGVQTALNFTKAKYTGENRNLEFGSTIERSELNTMLGNRDISIPGAGEYEVRLKSSKLPITLNREERTISYEEQYGKIPQSLKPEIAGPAAEKAAAIIIERKLNETNVGPGNYEKLNSSIIKKSFNSKAEDNMVE